MIRFIGFVIVTVLLLSSCGDSNSYHIDRQYSTVATSGFCMVDFYYPQLIFDSPDVQVDTLNSLLKDFVDYQYYAKPCDRSDSTAVFMHGDYVITLAAEQVLSIEYITVRRRVRNGSADTVYHSLVLDPLKVVAGDEHFGLLDLPSVFDDFDRGVLYPYVEEYNLMHGEHVNLNAYTSTSKTVLSWGLTDGELLLYIGGEGEFHGVKKLRIPRSKLE